MRLFTLDQNGKMIPYKEHEFARDNLETDLEDLLEQNPEYFFEQSKILVIGRQITTNLHSFIDLLGLDKQGNTVVIELKRDKTPRDTIAQILEYASFVENLDFTQLDEIFRNYVGEDITVDEYHREYFALGAEANVSFNKSIKLVIVAQTITPDIKQTAQFLRRKGIEIYCIEFRYFTTASGERILSSDIIIGEEEFLRGKVSSASLPKVDEDQFLQSLDAYGLPIFRSVFSFGKEQSLLFRWGSKGFSMNWTSNGDFVVLFYGYPPDSVFKQSIYTDFQAIERKVKSADEIISQYREALEKFGVFEPAGSNLKWVIDREYSEEEIQSFFEIITQIIKRMKEYGFQSM